MLDGKAFVAAANSAARRIDARQILQFQKWNSTSASAMIYSALRCRSRQLRVFMRFPHSDDMHQRRVAGFERSKNTRRHSSDAHIFTPPA